jgi:hypothetical protein
MSKGKESPPAEVVTPQPVNSEYWKNGELLGKTTLTGGVQKSESFMTPFDKSQQQLQQQYLPQYQQKLLNPDQNTKDSWKSMADATSSNERKAFNVDYKKAQDEMIQNLSSRGAFGGHSAGSSQVDHFGNELAKTAANQIDTINNNFTSNLDNYETNYNNKISNIINMLNGQAAQQQAVNQNNVSTATNGFNTGNNFNMNNYQNQMNQWALQQALKGGGGGNLTGSLLGAGASILGSPTAMGAIGKGAGMLGSAIGSGVSAIGSSIMPMLGSLAAL